MLFVCGCGGGGGGDEDGKPKFAGVWSGNLSVRTNTCSVQIPAGAGFLEVNERGEEVIVEIETGSVLLFSSAIEGGVFTGVTTSEDSFITTRQDVRNCFTSAGVEIPSSRTSQVTTVEFLSVDGDSARVRMTRDVSSCTGSSSDTSCQAVTEGAFTRVG